MILLVACAVRPPEPELAPPPRGSVLVGLDGWLVAQPSGETGTFSATMPESLEGIGDLPHLLDALGASPTPTAWRWPDTRIFPADPEEDEGFPVVPPPIREAPLEPLRLTVSGLRRDEGGLALVLRGPEDLYDPVVTRLRDEHPVLVGARQQVYKAFSLSCEEVELAPLPLEPKAGAVGRATCARLPIDGGWLVSTEYPVGDGSCTVWATIAADGTRSALSTACRDDLLGDASDRHREHHREHLSEMAYDSGAGPSSPEGWFRPEGAELLVLLNRFRGSSEDRCLARLPPPGEPWRPEGCATRHSLGP